MDVFIQLVLSLFFLLFLLQLLISFRIALIENKPFSDMWGLFAKSDLVLMVLFRYKTNDRLLSVLIWVYRGLAFVIRVLVVVGVFLPKRFQ